MWARTQRIQESHFHRNASPVPPQDEIVNHRNVKLPDHEDNSISRYFLHVSRMNFFPHLGWPKEPTCRTPFIHCIKVWSMVLFYLFTFACKAFRQDGSLFWEQGMMHCWWTTSIINHLRYSGKSPLGGFKDLLFVDVFVNLTGTFSGSMWVFGSVTRLWWFPTCVIFTLEELGKMKPFWHICF